MERYSIEIAKESDDFDLREILRNTKMQGDISLSFETEPSFFNAISILGEKQTVLSIRDIQKNKIIGFLIRSVKNVYINQKIVKVGYLSSIRLLEGYRGGRLLIKGNKELKKLLGNSTEKINFTTIIKDNIYAQQVISKSRVGLPDYNKIGVNKTFAIKPCNSTRYKNLNDITIQKGIDGFSIERVVSFINENGKKKNFFPVITKDLIENNYLKDFSKDDFFIAHKNNKILGIVGCWDQSKFKKSVVKGLSKKYKLLRLFNNYFLTHFLNTPTIPNVKQNINAFYLNLIVVKKNDNDVFSCIIDFISKYYSNKNYNYFLIGIDENDPLCQSMKNFRCFTYDAIVYLVDYSTKIKIEDRIKYLEISRL